MKKRFGYLLFALLALFGVAAPLQAAPSGSPYDSALGTFKDTNSAVDGFIGNVQDIDKLTAGKFADYLKHASIWKNLSGKSQQFIGRHIGKVGPLVKKLGWVANAIDLAPSVYSTVASVVKRDKKSFRGAFRDTALKTGSIVVGLGIGALVTASLPTVVGVTAATGGAALVVVAAGGAIISVGGGMIADKTAKKWFSKPLENFADKLYKKLINNDTGPSVGGGGSSPGGSKGGGSVKLKQLTW